MTDAQFAKGLEGVTATQSSVSFIDGQIGKLVYRGIPIATLAKESTFEEVSFLLLYGHLPKASELETFDQTLKANRDLPEELVSFLEKLPKDRHPMALMRTGVSILGAFDGNAESQDLEENRQKAVKLIAQFGSLAAAIQRIRQGKSYVPPRSDLNHAANFLYMLNGEAPTDYAAKVMDVCLILHADHGLNASTFTSIVTVSSLTDMYSAITAAVGSLKGPLHGGANTAVMKMLLKIGDPSKVEEAIAGKMARKEKIMGFGHRVYKAYDPRAQILSEYSQELAEQNGDTRWFEMSKAIEKIIVGKLGESKHIFPNVDFYSASVYYYMGIDPDMYTPIFAVSRISGWCAHVLEQLADNRIYRPRAYYAGSKDAEYVPMSQR